MAQRRRRPRSSLRPVLAPQANSEPGVASNTKLPPKPGDRSQQVDQHGASLTNERILKAQEALKTVRKFAPGLSSAASRVAGKRIEVVFDPHATGPYTDGKRIHLIPSLAFAEHVQHVPNLCDKRDDVTDKLLCPSCSRVDSMYATFQHEVAHLVHGSFDGMTEDEQKRALARIISEHGGTKFAERAAEHLKNSRGLGFMPAAGLISPYLPMLLNAFEDARVNREAMRKLPGLKRSFRADILDIMANGVEDPNTGERHPWSDRDVDSQAIIAAFLAAIGEHDCIKYLDQQVVDLYNDFNVRTGVDAINLAHSVSDAFEVAWTTLQNLRDHGFLSKFDPPDEDEPEPGPGEDEPESEDQQQDDSDGKSQEPDQGKTETTELGGDNEESQESDDIDSDGQGGVDSLDEESDGDEDSGKDDDEEDLPGGGGSSTDGDADDDEDDEDDDSRDDGQSETDKSDDAQKQAEEIEKLKRDLLRIMGHPEVPESTDESKLDLQYVDTQLDMMDSPSLNVSRVTIHQWPPKGRLAKRAWELTWRTPPDLDSIRDQAAVGRTVTAARMTFAENRAIHTTKGTRVGRVNTPALTRVKIGDDRVFRRRQRPDKRDYFAVIGLDISGSTSGSTLDLIRKIGWGMGDTFNRIGVEFSMYCHTGTTDAFSPFAESGQSFSCDLFEIKGANEPWNDRIQDRLRLINSCDYNLDGHTLEQYRRLAQQSNATDRIIFYLTDGAMPYANFNEEKDLLLKEIELCKKLGIKLIGIGVGNSDPMQYGLDTIRIDRMSELPRMIKEVGDRL